MGEVLKIGGKFGLATALLAAIAGVLLLISIPSVDFTPLSYYIGSVYAFAIHWCPVIQSLWTTALAMIGVNLALLTFRGAMVAVKLVWRVFE